MSTSRTLSVRLVLGLFRRAVTMLVVVGAVAAFMARSAPAQSSREVVGGPITTMRLERLLRAYVLPTDGEAEAIDRLHEAYLDRYRAEIEPEATALMSRMSGQMPSKEDFERFLRDLERLQAKLGEADEQFLNSATELLAEARRGGMQRVREARERQRQLSGLAGYAPMMFGGGGGVVDIAAIAVREEFIGRIEADRREAFDAALRSQEQRLLSQARQYNDAVGKAMMKFYEVATARQAATVDPDAPDSLDQAAKAAEEMRRGMMAIGEDVQKVSRAAFDGNRSGVAALAALMPEDVGIDFRIDFAERSNRDFFGNSGVKGSSASFRSFARRIARDGDIAPEAKEEVARIIAQWRRDHADAATALAARLTEAPSGMFEGFGSGEEGSGPVGDARRKVRETRRAALKAIAERLGERGSAYITTFQGFEEDGAEVQIYTIVDPSAPAEEVAEQAMLGEALRRSSVLDSQSGVSVPEPFATQDILRCAGLLGLDASAMGVVEAVVDGWRSAAYDPRMQPLAERIEQAASARSSISNGEIVHDGQACREYAELRAQALRAAFELDERLLADLAGALGLAKDDPLLLLLRLERVEIAASRAEFAMEAGVPCAPSRIFEAAKADPAVVRAVVDGAKDGLSAFASALSDRVAARLALAARSDEVQRVFATRDAAAVERASAEYMKLMGEIARSDAAFGSELAKLLDDAFAAHAGSADAAQSLRRTRLRTTYPGVYRLSDSALAQLAAAARLAGLAAEESARIEALAAEYEVVYDSLSAQMATGVQMPLGGVGDAEQWQAYQKQAEAVERARFLRKERTEKALSQLRRILGPERSALVPGLVRDGTERAPAESDPRSLWVGDDD